MDPSLIPVLGLYVCACVFFAYGLYYLDWIKSSKRQIKIRRNWPQTTGTVTITLTENDECELKRYWAEIYYSYTVLGVEYEGMFKREPLLGYKSIAYTNAQAFPIGNSLRVFYNPQFPSKHITEYEEISPHTQSLCVLGFAGGIICLIAAISKYEVAIGATYFLLFLLITFICIKYGILIDFSPG